VIPKWVSDGYHEKKNEKKLTWDISTTPGVSFFEIP
jgi:hypothetical protein